MKQSHLVATRSKRTLIGFDSRVAPRGMKTYSESKIELRKLQILWKMLEK